MRKSPPSILLLAVILSVTWIVPTLAAQEIFPCPPPVTELFSVGDEVVLTTQGGDVVYRTAWDYSEENVAYRLPPTSVVRIIAAPECSDYRQWWQITSEDGDGWITQFYNYSPGEAREYYDDGTIVLKVETPGFAPVLPSDTALGLGFSTGGAGGNFLHDEACMFKSVYPEQLTFDAEVIAFFLPCDPPELETPMILASGDTVRLTASELSRVWWEIITFSGQPYAIPATPTICYRLTSEGFEIFARTPTGDQVEPLIGDHFACEQEGYTAAQLPDFAYSQTGIWQLQVGSFSLNIEIPMPEYPIFGHYINDAGEYTLWLAGFAPNERVAIFIGHPFAGDGGPQTSQYFEVQMNGAGSFISTLETNERIYVAVGETGNVHWKGRCEGTVDYENSNEECAERLIEGFWGEGGE
jgi:hypothetical protein